MWVVINNIIIYIAEWYGRRDESFYIIILLWVMFRLKDDKTNMDMKIIYAQWRIQGRLQPFPIF